MRQRCFTWEEVKETKLFPKYYFYDHVHFWLNWLNFLFFNIKETNSQLNKFGNTLKNNNHTTLILLNDTTGKKSTNFFAQFVFDNWY